MVIRVDETGTTNVFFSFNSRYSSENALENLVRKRGDKSILVYLKTVNTFSITNIDNK